jgi:hypothetical protein
MATVLAMLWEKPSNSLSYLVYDSSTGGVLMLPDQVPIAETTVAARIRDIFNKVRVHTPSALEYKILQHGTPATNIKGRMQYSTPHATSLAVFNAVIAESSKLNISPKPQQKSKLTGTSLRKFRSGMRDLGLVARGKGTAWQVHLWAVALHATDNTHEKSMQKYWSILRRVSTRTKVGRMQFQEWYASL